MSELIYFILGSLVTIMAIITIVIDKENQDRYNRVQKRNKNRDKYHGTI